MKLKARSTEQFGLLGIAITIILIGGASLFIDIESLKEVIVSAGVWAPLLFILLKASTVIIAPLSGGPLYPLIGVFFGFWPGALYALIGDFIGYTGAFYISRIFGYPLVRKFIAHNEGSPLARIVAHAGTVRGLLHLCLTCFAMPELICYGTGLSKLAYWKFILILLPLSLIASSALVLLGSHLGATNNSLLFSLAAPIAALILISIGGWLFIRSIGDKK